MYIRGLSPLARELKANSEFIRGKLNTKNKMGFKPSTLTKYKPAAKKGRTKYVKSPFGAMVTFPRPQTRRMTRPGPGRTRLFRNVAKSGAGSTGSRYFWGRKTISKQLYALFQQSQEYIDESLRSRRIASLYGKQGVQVLNYNSTTDITRYFLTVPQMITPTDYLSGKFYIKETKSITTFTNQDLATCYVKMYQISPRFHTTNISPITQWDKGLESEASNSNVDYQDAYATPFISQDFVLFYKVDKVITFELGQGQSHTHSTVYNINRPVHGQLSSIFTTLQNISFFNLVVVSGTPLNDLTNKIAVSTSSCALDIVERVTTTYTYAASQRTKRFYTNLLPTITSAEIASVGAGIVVAEDEA